MDWLKLFRPKKYIGEKCVICGARLVDIGGGNGRCSRGHVFGPDAPRDPTATDFTTGDHRGDI